jgi:hypothetical protein
VDRSYPYPALFLPTGRGLSGLVFIGVAGCGRASALSFRVWDPRYPTAIWVIPPWE